MEIPDEARKLLESPALVHLTTLNSDGSPQVTCAWAGLEGDEVLIATHAITGLFVPRHERGIGHRLGKLRNFDFDTHYSFLRTTSRPPLAVGWSAAASLRHW